MGASKLLGKGIQGKVVSAIDTKNQMKKVAIKLFSKQAENKIQQKKEIEVLEKLRKAGEGFPKLMDWSTKRSRSYFVTDLLGDSLL
mmetsp:Transcript_39069/g.44698  ORF Transcript_39069/g.44698 Transcript_39069/m.44698 type:complete len:86 (-) Transcript_39069:1500-1757(-)